MTESKLYLLDANVFIEAHRRYYAFDLVSSFWTSLASLLEDDRVSSIDRILDELELGRDELSDWAAENFIGGFHNASDSKTIEEYKLLQTWAQSQTQYTAAAKSEFATVADAWLIAHAKAQSATIVTHEYFNSSTKKRIPMPNVCKAHNVHYCNTFDMLRKLGVKLS